MINSIINGDGGLTPHFQWILDPPSIIFSGNFDNLVAICKHGR